MSHAMDLRFSVFQKTALLALPLACLPASAQGFTVRDAIQAEWRRQPPVFNEAEKSRLSPADRARLERTLARIGAPGAPALLPPELEAPTEAAWLERAARARTPQERVTALAFLNRLKSRRALKALEGLGAADAAAWPKPLHLEAAIATARLNGGEVAPALQGFLEGLAKAGKVDPVRAQAAQLRLVMAGLEKELRPPVPATPGAILALLDAWNRAPWEKRKEVHARMFENPALHGSDIVILDSTYRALGLCLPSSSNSAVPPPPPMDPKLFPLGRLIEGLEPPVSDHAWKAIKFAAQPRQGADPMTRIAAISAIPKCKQPDVVSFAKQVAKDSNSTILAAVLPTLRTLSPAHANTLQARLLLQADPIARAAAIDDLTAAPADLEALVQRLWKVEEYDGVQVLLPALEKWSLPAGKRKALLERFCGHPCWTARLDAWRELVKLDPRAPWPAPPKPTATDEAILKLAAELAEKGRPVRLRLAFEGGRAVVLKLDPVNAPMNVANLVLLARRGFFDGRRVPRVVPDFVVQMGSPCDTMDGGPGYTVRCEDSLDWFGPGSVGMALSGKDTGGSQFFITTNAAPHLTGHYTRLGALEDLDRALPLLDDLELGARIEKVTVLEP